MGKETAERIRQLSEFITPRRLKLFREVLSYRTRYLTVVLEDIYQPHNASAVLRSCECFGIQDLHIIENRNQYRVNPDVVMGASKWLNLIRYNETDQNTSAAIEKLRLRHYRIVATSLDAGAVPIEQFDLSRGKSAFFFGTELTGLSDEMLEQADEFVRIQMYGFTGSFNISVTAAILLHQLVQALHGSDIQWRLSAGEQEELLLQWLEQAIQAKDRTGQAGFS